MQGHSEFYQFATSFWWLVFPIGWGFAGLLRVIFRHHRAEQTLALLKSYADQGKEPPPELLALLRQPDQADAAKTARKNHASYGWFSVFLFGALACGFVLLAGFMHEAVGDRMAVGAMLFTAIVMAGVSAGSFVAMRARQKQTLDQPDRIPPP